MRKNKSIDLLKTTTAQVDAQVDERFCEEFRDTCILSLNEYKDILMLITSGEKYCRHWTRMILSSGTFVERLCSHTLLNGMYFKSILHLTAHIR